MWSDIFQTEKPGYYGQFGGMFIPEILRGTFEELIEAFESARNDPSFWTEYVQTMQSYSCRPTPITYLPNLSEKNGGAQIYCKREDLNQTGAHKANNVMGQGLLVKRMGKSRVIAETGAGQHGVATATMAARFGLECTIYMGALDVERQRPNVFWMEQLGAEVVAVTEGSATLKDAINAAMRDWSASMDDTHYALGTVCGPHPFPTMVSYFQSLIGQESREQILELTGKLPDRNYACVGGGSNAMGLFYPFLNDKKVKIIGVEAAGRGAKTEETAATMTSGTPGILHGSYSYVLQDNDGQIKEAHSISAGLDYPGVGPEHSHLKDIKRVKYFGVTDKEALEAFQTCSKLEGIIPALEPSHALAYLIKAFKNKHKNKVVILNMCGRGDKDLFTAAKAIGFDADE